MTPPPFIIGNIAESRWFAHAWRRRVIVVVLLVLFGLLALFPRQYRIAASLTPTDPATLGLSGALGQFGSFTNVFGSQAAIEVSLKVARSLEVRQIVVRKLDLVRTRHFADDRGALRWVEKQVDIRSLRGGIIQMEMKNADPQLGLSVVGAFADATRERLATISRQQTAYKRGVLVDLVKSSKRRLDLAQDDYDAFRRRTRYSQPGVSIGAIGQRGPAIQAALKAKEVQLQAARAFATDDNLSVRQIIAEVNALKTQLNEASSLDSSDPNSVNRVVVQSTQVQDLERDLGVARNLYESYRRFLDGTAVEDITATGNVRILEPPYVDTDREYSTLPAALFILVLLAGLAIEFYLLRPPLGSRSRELRQVP